MEPYMMFIVNVLHTVVTKVSHDAEKLLINKRALPFETMGFYVQAHIR